MKLIQISATTIVLTFTYPAIAVPVVPPDPPFSAARIERLPPEVRRVVLSRCGAHAEAGHYFATYDNHSNVIRLDYSALYCPSAPKVCDGPACLLQTYVLHGGKYVLSQSRSYHPPFSR
ncbi:MULTISPECIES: hypothetical protein [unclassified Bradyrhizobium]